MDLVSYLLGKVEKRQAEISETLMSNGVKNMEEYKYIHHCLYDFSNNLYY